MTRFRSKRLGVSGVSAARAAGMVTVVSLYVSGVGFAGQDSISPTSESAFEVASVKPSQIENGNWSWQGLTLVATGTTVEQLIFVAYQVAPFQVLGGPDWMKRERFEIRAKAPQVDPTRPMNALQQQQRVFSMLRTLLAERFALRVREETRVLPRYVLLPRDEQRDKPRGMRPPDPECEQIRAAALQGAGRPPVASPAKPCRIFFRESTNTGLMTISAGSTSMSELTTLLEGFLERHVADQSGIEGYFGLELTIGRDQIPRLALSAVPTVRSGGPSIAGALADDLNLTLRSENGPVPVVVVEHLEHPTPN